MKYSIVFIVNPRSGTQRAKEVHKYIDKYLDKERFNFSVISTEYRGHGKEIAAKCVKDKVKIIVSVGGDGTLFDILQSVVNSSVMIAVWPYGSGNGVARSLQLSFKAKDVLQGINSMQSMLIDIGKANQYYFTSNFGLGFDAMVSKSFVHSKKRGFFTYLKLILKLLPGFKSENLQFFEGNKRFDFSKVFILNAANMKQLGYDFEIAPLADCKDGELNITLIKSFPLLMAPILALYAFFKKIHKSPYVKTFTSAAFIIKGLESEGMQLDGEYIPLTAIEKETLKVEVIPQAIRLIKSNRY
ncbi:MAG TPA: diacylglycerol kinase family protein [Chitinophagaceae bacterium]|nr:diacylglycerol kinase family protein [Chitinophagaceae bacterium]